MQNKLSGNRKHFFLSLPPMYSFSPTRTRIKISYSFIHLHSQGHPSEPNGFPPRNGSKMRSQKCQAHAKPQGTKCDQVVAFFRTPPHWISPGPSSTSTATPAHPRIKRCERVLLTYLHQCSIPTGDRRGRRVKSLRMHVSTPRVRSRFLSALEFPTTRFSAAPSPVFGPVLFSPLLDMGSKFIRLFPERLRLSPLEKRLCPRSRSSSIVG
jgi:hypothetical protein